MSISIHHETPNDCAAIRQLTIAAFENSEFGHHGEAELIDALRITSPNRLSLVACLDDRIVGHILFTPVTIRTPNLEIQGMGLAPISVSPRFQRTGIGSALIIEGLRQLFETSCPAVVVLGHPNYYTKFGFQPAKQYGVTHGFAGIPQDVFLMRCNPLSAMTQLADGRAYYQPEFGPQHNGL